MTVPSAPPPARAAPPPPPEVHEPPSFIELLESGARAPFSPAEVFGGLAARPEPQSAEASLALLGWGAVTAAVMVAYALTRLNAGTWGVLPLAAGALGGLILAVPAGLALAGMLHMLSGLSGGQRGYWRSVEAAAGLGAVPALCLAALWAPDPSWMGLPILYATWLTVCAVEKLHDAPSGQVWMVVGVCGLLLAGSTWAGRDKLTLAIVRLENAATVLSNNPAAAEEQRRTAALAAPLSAPSRSAPADRLRGEPGSAGPIEDAPQEIPGGAPRSSLDYLSPPTGGGDDEERPRAPDAMRLRDQGMQSGANNLIQTLRRQLESPALMQGLAPEQAASLKKLLSQVEGNMKGGQGGPRMTPEETQRLLQQFMGAAKGGARPAAQPSPRKRRRPAPPPSDE